jgi:hypothetical protein
MRTPQWLSFGAIVVGLRLDIVWWLMTSNKSLEAKKRRISALAAGVSI